MSDYNEVYPGYYIAKSGVPNIIKFFDLHYKSYFAYGRYRNKALRKQSGLSYGIYLNSGVSSVTLHLTFHKFGLFITIGKKYS